MESDDHIRAELHRLVGERYGNSFSGFATAHRLPFVEVMRAAWLGGTISDAVAAAIEKERNAT